MQGVDGGQKAEATAGVPVQVSLATISLQPAASSGATHSWRWVGHAAVIHSSEQKRACWQRPHLRSRPPSGRRVAPQWVHAWRWRCEPPAAAAAAAAAEVVLPPAAEAVVPPAVAAGSCWGR